MNIRKIFVGFAVFWGAAVQAQAPRQMENLTRGMVAVRTGKGIFISWRIFGTDPLGTRFHLYRVTDKTLPVQVMDAPLSISNYLDTEAEESSDIEYFVRPIVNDKELPACKPCRLWQKSYLEIPIQTIEGYRPGDASVADLDGDGDYELILHQHSNPRDNSHAGLTGRPILDAYELDGTHLWRIDLGLNIRDGEHYTQFMVYDLDGDGRAELVCKTADGTVDGVGTVIGDAHKDYRVLDAKSKRYGRVLSGPEFLTVFHGQTGAAMQTVEYVPGRDPIDGWGGIGGNGGNDEYGNRCDRFLACVAYLDGKRPSVVMCRGVYGRIVAAAWDWRDGQLSRRWVFDSGVSYPPYQQASKFSGMGGHSLSVADVDDDGRDEIVYQAMVIDDDGTGLNSSGLRHGDAMHISDMDPDRLGLEVFTVQENEEATVRFQTPGEALRDAKTGKILWSYNPGMDVPAGVAADIDPNHRGFETWTRSGTLRNVSGKELGAAPRSSEFLIWWDGDLLRELCGGNGITKWNWKTGNEDVLLDFPLSRRRQRWPTLVADLLGDWREEYLVSSPDGKSIQLYTTTTPTVHALPTLMHDAQYRLSIAWQNVVYNKPAHTSFYLGDGMTLPRRPEVTLVGSGEAYSSHTLRTNSE